MYRRNFVTALLATIAAPVFALAGRVKQSRSTTPKTDGVLKLYDAKGRLLAESPIRDGKLWQPAELQSVVLISYPPAIRNAVLDGPRQS